MPKTSDSTATLSTLAELAKLVAESESPDQVYASVAAAAEQLIGCKLVTIMAFDEVNMRVQRLYTNNPDAYPPGGGKGKRDTDWGRHVLIEGRAFIGRSSDDIRANFDDYDLILQLGLASVLNMPVRIHGRTIGTLNLLHEAGFYDEKDLDMGNLLAGQLAGTLGIRQ